MVTAKRRSNTGRQLRVRLSPSHQALLERLASEYQLDPRQLAQVWLVEKIERHAAIRASANLDTQIGASRLKPRATGAAATEGGASEYRRRPSDRLSLHEEIASVIADNGPMSVAEIAAQIKRRGNYKPPRAKTPISAAIVSRRVSNANYRSMFDRVDGKVSLVRRGRPIA